MGNSVINSYPKVFTQFAGDNVDHNIKTLDGSGTFHGMGIIAISTPFPGNSVLKECDKISRGKDITSEVSANNKGIAIHNYVHPVKSALSSMEVKPLIKLQSPVILPSNDIDNLWQASWYFRNSSNYRPNWSRYMQNISKGEYPGQSKITYLPIIDLNPTKEKCIYSTLLFIQEQAKLLNIVTPCLTFDQPFWLKTVEITKSKSMNVVCRLGGFYLLMSFLGSIRKVMECSGISELFQVVYSSATAVHMLSGKAYARSLRVHFLVQSSLELIILQFISLVRFVEQLSTYDRKYLLCW